MLDKDYHNLIAAYETAHLEQIGNISDTGTDHGFYGMRITPNLMAANMFDRLKLVLPEENGLMKSDIKMPTDKNFCQDLAELQGCLKSRNDIRNIK